MSIAARSLRLALAEPSCGAGFVPVGLKPRGISEALETGSDGSLAGTTRRLLGHASAPGYRISWACLVYGYSELLSTGEFARVEIVRPHPSGEVR